MVVVFLHPLDLGPEPEAVVDSLLGFSLARVGVSDLQ